MKEQKIEDNICVEKRIGAIYISIKFNFGNKVVKDKKVYGTSWFEVSILDKKYTWTYPENKDIKEIAVWKIKYQNAIELLVNIMPRQKYSRILQQINTQFTDEKEKTLFEEARKNKGILNLDEPRTLIKYNQKLQSGQGEIGEKI